MSTCTDRPGSYHRSQPATICRAMFILMLPSLAGCTASKQMWKDWQDDAKAAPRADLVLAPSASSISPPAPASLAPGYQTGEGARAGEGFDLDMRNPDFPRTYIQAIHIDLTGPDHWVHLQWTGPIASQGPIGPWQSTPGRGQDNFDCDDVRDSNTIDSFCTPKGTFHVAGFADHLRLTPQCTYATWILHAPRFIAMHGHTDLPRKAASSGCVRLPVEAAKLIHNNSITGVTLVTIEGKWTRPR